MAAKKQKYGTRGNHVLPEHVTALVFYLFIYYYYYYFMKYI